MMITQNWIAEVEKRYQEIKALVASEDYGDIWDEELYPIAKLLEAENRIEELENQLTAYEAKYS